MTSCLFCGNPAEFEEAIPSGPPQTFAQVKPVPGWIPMCSLHSTTRRMLQGAKGANFRRVIPIPTDGNRDRETDLPAGW